MIRTTALLLVLSYIAYRFLAPWWAFRVMDCRVDRDGMEPWGHRVG